MCDHIRREPRECEHDEVAYCPICDRCVCVECGKEWGKKEIVYQPYPYYPSPNTNPYPWQPIITWTTTTAGSV